MKAKCLPVRTLIIFSLVGVSLLLPAPSVKATPAQQGGVLYHTVVRGESLARIAARYGTTIGTIARWNGIANPNVIYAGQRLAIPTAGSAPSPSVRSVPASSCSAGCTYRIVWGDTLARIAARHGTTVSCLMSANGLRGSNILAGATLRVPCVGTRAAPAVSSTKAGISVAGRASYRVRPGDTLSSIALLYRTTVQAIMAANGLSNPHHIYAGQVLQIPLR
jgi:LysM repeat protein